MSGSLKRERKRGEGGLKGSQQLKREALEQEEMVREVRNGRRPGWIVCFACSLPWQRLCSSGKYATLTLFFSCAVCGAHHRFPSLRKK